MTNRFSFLLVFARKHQILRYSCQENGSFTLVNSHFLDFESLVFDVFLSNTGVFLLTQARNCYFYKNFVMGAAPILKFSIEDYLESERKSFEKHEFYQGEIFAMAGASIQHNQIVGNTLVSVGSHLSNSSKCQVFPSDLKIHCQSNSLFTYPDLSIICGKIETLENHKDIVTNPIVLIEVLSESTRDYDRGEKFRLYREINSLKEYILISSLEMLVEKYEKQPDGTWILHEYKNENDDLFITNISLQLKLKSLFRNVMFT
jgi:Uma2 family endonuclease